MGDEGEEDEIEVGGLNTLDVCVRLMYNIFQRALKAYAEPFYKIQGLGLRYVSRAGCQLFSEALYHSLTIVYG